MLGLVVNRIGSDGQLYKIQSKPSRCQLVPSIEGANRLAVLNKSWRMVNDQNIKIVVIRNRKPLPNLHFLSGDFVEGKLGKMPRTPIRPVFQFCYS